MHKFSFVVVFLLLSSVVMVPGTVEVSHYGARGTGVSAVSSGLKSFYAHEWGVFSPLMVVRLGGNLSSFNPVVGEFVGNLTRALDQGRFVIVVGKVYDQMKIAYIAPFVVLGDELDLDLSVLDGLLGFNVSSGLSSFSFPKGTSLPAGSLLSLVQVLVGQSGFNLTGFIGGFVANFSQPFNGSQLNGSLGVQPPTSAVVYNYSKGALLPPAPLLPPDDLSYYASSWSGIIQAALPGVQGATIVKEGSIEFRAKGVNTTTFNDSSVLVLRLDMVSEYNKTTGVLENLYLDVNATYINGTDTYSFRLRFASRYLGGEQLDFRLRNEDTLKLAVTEATHTEVPTQLVNYLPNVFNLTLLNTIDLLLRGSNITFTYYDQDSPSGIDLFYNMVLRTSLGINSTQIYVSDLMPLSPYLLDVWDLVASNGQLVMGPLIDQVVGAIARNLTSFSPNTTLKVSTDYYFLYHGNESVFDYASMLAETRIFYQNITGSTTVPGVRATIKILTWFTYDNVGYLSEIGVLSNITSLRLDTDGDGVFDSPTFSNIYYKIILNRVVSSQYVEANSESYVNPPDPDPNSNEWYDATPMRLNYSLASFLDDEPPKLNSLEYNYDIGESGLVITFYVNVSDESPIHSANVSLYYDGKAYYSALEYNEDEGLYTAVILLPLNETVGKIEVNGTVAFVDIYGNAASKDYRLVIDLGGFGGADLVFYSALVVAFVGIVVLMVYLKKRS